MVKMDLKFIKTSNRSSFLSIKLLFSGFQISFPMFLNNLLCKKTSYCNCNRHLMFLCQECDILLLNEKLLTLSTLNATIVALSYLASAANCDYCRFYTCVLMVDPETHGKFGGLLDLSYTYCNWV